MKDSENFKWIKPSDDKHDKILKLIEGKTLNEKFRLALLNKCKWLIFDLIKEGLDIHDFEIDDMFEVTDYSSGNAYTRIRSRYQNFESIYMNKEMHDFICDLQLNLKE